MEVKRKQYDPFKGTQYFTDEFDTVSEAYEFYKKNVINDKEWYDSHGNLDSEFKTEKPQLMEVFESIGQTPVTDVIITLIAPIIAYGILNFPFGYLLMLFYYFRVPASLTVETEAYFFTCNPEEKARFEEENTILEKAREIKARRKKEALFTKK